MKSSEVSTPSGALKISPHPTGAKVTVQVQRSHRQLAFDMTDAKGREQADNKDLCAICLGFQQVRQKTTLLAVSEAAAAGCLRCKLLYGSAMVFKEDWAEDVNDEAEKSITVMVGKHVNGENGPVVAGVQWPVGEANACAIPIHISTEVSESKLGL